MSSKIHRLPHQFEVNGIVFGGPIKDSSRLEVVQRLSLDKSDLIISSYPKAGNNIIENVNLESLKRYLCSFSYYRTK